MPASKNVIVNGLSGGWRGLNGVGIGTTRNLLDTRALKKENPVLREARGAIPFAGS